MTLKRLSVLIVSAAAVLGASLASAADYNIDPVHTTLIYRIKHLNASYSYGRFDSPTGAFSYDPASPEKSTFSLEVKVDNINSGNPQRDGHLKSPDFFNAKQYPTITFKSTAVKKTADDKLDVTGDLTIHGVTKSVTVPLAVVGTAKGMAGETRTGFEGTIELKRSEFDVKGLPGAVGEDVRIIVSIEGIAK
jgi:polyisoprenoid-binding protein YceI